MKPLVFYVDDEPHNLTVFEAAMDGEWEVKTFTSPMEALKALDQHDPAVILSDQRMPQISGVEFLELAKKIRPFAVRIIVTGYSDEDLIIQSVRKAQIFDYLRKPWDPDELAVSLGKAVDYRNIVVERESLFEQLRRREAELLEKNLKLSQTSVELTEANKREAELRSELECWVPPLVLWAIRDEKIQFPTKRDLVGIAFDIVKSSALHGINIGNRPVRSLVLAAFSESILKHGGWRESHSGDSGYGHFGLFEDHASPFDAALAAGREFRVALRNFSQVHGVNVEAGISLHAARDSIVDIHSVQLLTARGTVIQKSFDTTSTEIDLLHRMEKLVHKLPGSNIIMSGDFIKQLKNPPPNVVELGRHTFRGQSQPTDLFAILSDRVDAATLATFKAELGSPDEEKKAA